MLSLYIGLGEAGISAVAEFAKKAKDQNLMGNEFIYIDTDEYVLREYPFISDDFLSLSKNMPPEYVYEQALRTLADTSASESEKRRYKQFMQWFDADNPEMRTCRPIDTGSEGEPMLARTMLFANYEKVRRTIFQKLAYLSDDFHYPKVYVVSGTCGGTGNGILLDILYMLNDIQNEDDQNEGYHILYPGFVTNLVLVMPEGVSMDDVRYRNYRLNAYALFDEINACLKDYCGSQGDDNRNGGMQWHKHKCFDNDEVPPFQFEVYKIGFFFDSIGSFGQPLSRKEIAENVANFLLMYGEAQPFHPIVYNNIHAEKFNSRDNAFIKGFAATGTFVAQTWEELTRKYVHDKFIYQMLQYGFVGSGNELPHAQLMSDVNSFKERIQSIFQHFPLDNLIVDILNDDRFRGIHGYDELIRIMDHLKDAVAYAGKTPSIEKEPIDYGRGRELVNAINHLLREVREATYTLCSEWAMKYSLYHALQIVEHLDLFYDMSFKDKMAHMMCFEPTSYFQFLIKKERLRQELHVLFKDYIEYLVYRNLSNEHDGYLDHCKQFLHAAIGEVENKFLDYRIDGIRVAEWERCYIKYLNGLIHDPTRVVYPNLGYLLDDNYELREGNQVERDYANLVCQRDESKSPDMTFDLNNDKLLYTYRQKCIARIIQKDKRWADRFKFLTHGLLNEDVTPKRNFVDDMAFWSFVKEVEAIAAELSQDKRLNKPFSNLTLSQTEMADLVNRLVAFNRVELNTRNETGNASSESFYLADFNNLPWLQNALNLAAAPNVQTIQSDNMPDRIMKLHIGFGYSFDDYRYFGDYRHYFEEYFEHPSECPHQPFVDKRFLTDRRPGESLAEMFEREAQERNS